MTTASRSNVGGVEAEVDEAAAVDAPNHRSFFHKMSLSKTIMVESKSMLSLAWSIV